MNIRLHAYGDGLQHEAVAGTEAHTGREVDGFGDGQVGKVLGMGSARHTSDGKGAKVDLVPPAGATRWGAFIRFPRAE